MKFHESTKIHPSALISDGAEIGSNCEIGPFSVIGNEVILKDNVLVKSHVVISGQTTIGSGSIIFPFASIGEIPQDLKYSGEKTKLIIGERNKIRENVTMNPGTKGGGGVTLVGDDCLFMTGAHVGHDARLGDRIVIANQSAIAGHCQIDDDAIIGGLSGVHQFVRIGRGAIIGAVTMVTNDVIPYGLVQARRGELDGLNYVGLKRSGVSRVDIMALRAGYQMLKQGDGTFQQRAEKLLEETDSRYVKEVVDFILSESHRSFLIPG